MESQEAADASLNRIQRVRNRTLDDPDQVFEKNAWDDVEWGDEQIRQAEEKLLLNSADPLPEEQSIDHLLNAAQYWEEFYKRHDDKFFKDRKWLESEFPELIQADDLAAENGGEDATVTVLETGCGAGNTVLPLLQATRLAYTLSATMVSAGVHVTDKAKKNCASLVKENDFLNNVNFDTLLRFCTGSHSSPPEQSRDKYNPERCKPFVADLTDHDLSHWPVKPASVDFIIMLFTLSAIRPERMKSVVHFLASLLKPGGWILFRDYGKYDLAQLRFKPTQCAAENLYIRQDGTLAYFFTQDEIRRLFCDEGFCEVQNAVDRRLLVNRKRGLLMHRVWIQCKFLKGV